MGRRSRRRGEGSTLSSPGSRRRGGLAGLAPVATPVGGTGKGARGSGRWARPAGPGVGPVGPGVQWGGGPSLFFSLSVLFSVFFLFVYIIFCFISFKSI